MPKFPDDERVVLVAFVVNAKSSAKAQQWLMSVLPKPEVLGPGGGWWIAEDERLDGSDGDSAIFVDKGEQSSSRLGLFSSKQAHGMIYDYLANLHSTTFLGHENFSEEGRSKMATRLVEIMIEAGMVEP